MQGPHVFCPTCGAADTSTPNPQGFRQCTHCHARYQISSVLGQAIQPARSSSTALIALTLAAVSLLIAGIGALVFFSADRTDPSQVSKATASVAAVPEPTPEPEPATPPEPESQPEDPPKPSPKPPVAGDDAKAVPDGVVDRPTLRKRLNRPDPAVRYRVDIDGANFRGPKDAPVTIVLFTDFECPFCKRINKTLAEVTDHYGDDVRIAYMHNPLGFHARALPAAKAVEAAAAQGKFWEMHGLLFRDKDALARSDFDAYARQLGLDQRRFSEVFDDPTTERRIKSQQREASRLRANGTPASFVNGRFLSGAQPFEPFAALIDAELDAAKDLMAEGTPRSKVHETLMKDALPGI